MTPHIHVTERGSGAAVVLLHGLGDDHRSWQPIVELLGDRRCVAIDLRGHGASSDVETYELEEYAGDVEGVLDRMALGAPTVAGHSLGGLVAALVAGRRPVHATICVDQVLDVGAKSKMVGPAAEAVRTGDHVGLLASVVETLGWGDVAPDIKRGIVERRAGLPREVMLGTWRALLEGDATALAETKRSFSRIRAPMVSLHGRDPGAAYAEWLKATVPSARIEVWPRGGHYPHLSEPQRFAELVREVSGVSALTPR